METRATLIKGIEYDYLYDLFTRMCCGEEIGTEQDEMFAGGMLKYGMLGNTCCEGKHLDAHLEELGYEKKGGGIHAE